MNMKKNWMHWYFSGYMIFVVYLLSSSSPLCLPLLSASSLVVLFDLCVVACGFLCCGCCRWFAFVVVAACCCCCCCVLFVCCCCFYVSSSSLVFPVINASRALELVITIMIFSFHFHRLTELCARRAPNEPPPTSQFELGLSVSPHVQDELAVRVLLLLHLRVLLSTSRSHSYP